MPALIVFSTAIGALMYLGLITKTWAGLSFATLYMYNFVPQDANYTAELAHTWSLAVEEHFYLMWPWLLLFATPLHAKKAAIYLLLFCGLVYIAMGPSPHARWTIPAMAPILAGSLLALLNQYPPKTLPKADSKTAFSLYLLPLFISSALYKFIWIFHLIGIALIINHVATNPEARLSRLLSFQPLVYFGTISYGLYLWQGQFITNSPIGEKLWMQQFPQNIAFTLFAAIISYHTIEKFALAYKKRFSAIE